jgi:methionyl-tRNA formyltransferase
VITPPPVKVAAERLGIRILQPHDINSEPLLQPETHNPKPDYLVVVAYGQLLKAPLLALPKIAPVNVHASLLPRWRGASPIQNAILAGDAMTGVTVQRMVQKLDAGPVLAQQSIPIGLRETFIELHDRLAKMGADLLLQTLTQELHPKEQAADGITVCKKLSRANGMVDPQTMPAEDIDKYVRALHPWPGVTLSLGKDSSLKILATDLQPSAGAAALSCKDQTTLYLVSVQVPGGKPLTGKEWERGRKL